MNVSLPPEIEKQIEQRVASGRYTSASDVMTEALQHFFRADEARIREREALNQRLAEGLAQLDRGEAVRGDDARRITRERIEARRRRGTTA